ncbi:MAG: hypothetical protein Q8R63_06495 [Ramlibacter sp.]|nr:hypothetical protein [Ramlibacter sp.]
MHHPAITFIAPYRIYLPTKFFETLIDGRRAKVQAAPMPAKSVQGASQVNGANVEIAHDIFGFAGRTRFDVVLDEAIDVSVNEWKTRVCERDGEFVGFAIKAVNRFLAVYRDKDVNQIGERSFHVIELVRGDLSDIRLLMVDDDLNVLPDFAITWPAFGRMGFGDAVLRDPQVVASIQDHLATGQAIPIYRELLTSASNHLWRQQLTLVPVEATAAFESYSYAALQGSSPRCSLPDSSDLFTKLQALEASFAAAATTRAKSFAPWFDPTVPGWKGLVNAALKQWYGDCYIVRNKVIHRGYTNVTQLKAEAALTSTHTAIALIQQCISQQS